MNPRIDVINLGVTDLDQARRFYEGAFGADRGGQSGAPIVLLGGNASRVALRQWDAVARDAGVEPHAKGFRAFTLSYILDSAEDVDEVLRRAERHGGRITKPPKNALWGYSAYVTDPGGYLWKVASSKRRPLLSRKDPAANNGHAIKPQEVPITIGVADMKRAKDFYTEGVGLPVKKAFGNKFVMFGGDGGTSDLGMYKREALADDAAVPPEGEGFHGFSITHFVDSPAHVDALLARAEQAGGQIVKPAGSSAADSYGGYFGDLDGNLWQVVSRD